MTKTIEAPPPVARVGTLLAGRGPDHTDQVGDKPRFDMLLDAARSGVTATRIGEIARDPAVETQPALARAPPAIGTAARSAGQTVAILDAATDGTIVVSGCPHLFDAEQDSALMSAPRAEQLNTLTDQLNAALENAVEAEVAVSVDVAERFEGHGIGSEDPWIHFDPADPAFLHHTSRGYRSGCFRR